AFVRNELRIGSTGRIQDSVATCERSTQVVEQRSCAAGIRADSRNRRDARHRERRLSADGRGGNDAYRVVTGVVNVTGQDAALESVLAFDPREIVAVLP